MLRRPPSSPLFPYTTLFRSKYWTAAQVVSFLEATAGDRLGPLWVTIATTGLRRGEALALRWSDLDLDKGDRKSTRLNSSHRCISYAVFCLKKKTHHSARSLH